jgi:hypothetical protein
MERELFRLICFETLTLVWLDIAKTGCARISRRGVFKLPVKIVVWKGRLQGVLREE